MENTNLSAVAEAKKPSVTIRNLVGAFLGGFLGILGYAVSAWLLPFTCLLGVIVGFWHQEIWQYIFTGWSKGVATANTLRALINIEAEAAGKRWKRRLTVYNRFAQYVMLGIIWAIIWPLAMIGRFMMWVVGRTKNAKSLHPITWVYVTRVLASVIFLAISTTFIVMLAKGTYHETFNAKGEPTLLSVPIGLGLLVLAFYTLVAPFTLLFGPGSYRNEMSNFYEPWERYSNYGPLRFAIQDLRLLFAEQLFFLSMVATYVIWWVVAGASLLVFIIVPILAIVGMIKGIYDMSMKRGHLLCFIATLITTCVTAWTMSDNIADPVGLWVTALLAGGASMVTTEVTRRLLVRLFGNYQAIYLLAVDPLEERLERRFTGFAKFSNKVTGATIAFIQRRLGVQWE